jgi:hypothetical protein
MKKMTLCLALLFFALDYGALAQKQINVKDIKKILLVTGWGGMGGWTDVSMEILPEQNQWNSYQTGKAVDNRFEKERNERSVERKHMATLSITDMNNLLTSIAVVKPYFNWHIFGITSENLKTYVRNGPDPEIDGPKISDYVNDKTIAEAIITSQKNSIMDAGVHCSMMIVTGTNDTIKLDTRNMNICMQPWKIGSKETYDMSINRFFVAAMGKEAYPNKDLLQAESLKKVVVEDIYHTYAAAPMSAYQWEHDYPGNLKLIKSNYTITDLKLRGFFQGHGVLHSSTMPKNAIIEAGINLANTASVQKLVRFKDTLTAELKANNFVFKYYSDRPEAKLIFPWDYSYGATGYIIWSEIQKQVPSLTKSDAEKMIYVHVEVAHGGSYWLLLPDGKLILLFNSGNNPAGLDNALVHKVTASLRFDTYAHYVLFNLDGTLTKQ